MSWRTVVITNRCKLDLSMGYMVIRSDETKRIFLDEMAILIIENPAVSVTGCLLAELSSKKIRVIFCDDKRSPYGELQPYSDSHDCSRKIRTQTEWTDSQRKNIWTEIVGEKIRNQARILAEFGHDAESAMLQGYADEMQYADETNREGHAAKVYFNALFGKGFSRGQENPTNAALNYGYSLLLSAFNREVTLNGYLTQLGIFHDNIYNPFNLSSDIMEPLRPIIDRKVLLMSNDSFGKSEKLELVSLLHSTYTVHGSEQTLLNAVKIYAKSVFDAINDNDVSLINFVKI